MTNCLVDFVYPCWVIWAEELGSEIESGACLPTTGNPDNALASGLDTFGWVLFKWPIDDEILGAVDELDEGRWCDEGSTKGDRGSSADDGRVGEDDIGGRVWLSLDSACVLVSIPKSEWNDGGKVCETEGGDCG